MIGRSIRFFQALGAVPADLHKTIRQTGSLFPADAVGIVVDTYHVWWDSQLAGQIGQMPRFGLAMAKRAVNQCEDQMGLRPGMDSVFGLHHVAHAHNAEVQGDSLAGLDARGMRDQT